MPRLVTIVMYHFVRNLLHSRFPEIKGLTVDQFKEQIEYIRKHYHVIRMEDLISAVSGNYSLPPNALLLTFDDGYIDHFTNVFPILKKYQIQGCFFPPAKAITECRVLDVNKIHFILASVKDNSKIIKFICSEIAQNKNTLSLRNPKDYYEELAVPNRYDNKDIVFIKRILQRELPEALRSDITDKLFYNFVTDDEKSFSKELYMTTEQLKYMRRHGMFIGSHGYDHYWLNTLTQEQQAREIDLSLKFLARLGCELKNWVICYPYGAYNESLLSLLKNKGCKLGLSVHIGIADLEKENPLTLSRLDTNDLPKWRNAMPNEWTLQASGS